MSVNSYLNTPWRIGKFKGNILKRAVPGEVLQREGRQVQMPKNYSNTYVARRFLPYGATATNANTINRFFQDGTGDRTLTMIAANQTSDGVTGTPDAITPQDTTVVIQQYSCLYGFTDQTYDLGEDDIAKESASIVGERVTLVNEQIVYGALNACTNVYYGGTGTSRATVNGALTLNLLRKIAQNLMANHGSMVNTSLKAGPDFGTSAVSAGFSVYAHTDLEPDIRDLPNFIPVEKYASRKPRLRNRFVRTLPLRAVPGSAVCAGRRGRDCRDGPVLDQRDQHRRVPHGCPGQRSLQPDRSARRVVHRPDHAHARPEGQERPARPARLRGCQVVQGRDAGKPRLDGIGKRGPQGAVMTRLGSDPRPTHKENTC